MKLELYDLAKDVGEQHDVAEKYPEQVAELERLMVEAHVPSKLFPLFANEKKSPKVER